MMARILLFVLMLVCLPFAFNVSTTSFTVDSFHYGIAGGNITTATLEGRSTLTHQQPGDVPVRTSSYQFNLGWYPFGGLGFAAGQCFNFFAQYDPIILGNPNNYSTECDDCLSALVTINNSGSVTDHSMTEGPSGNWSVSVVDGGLNASNISYTFKCTNVSTTNITSTFETIMLLPNMTLNMFTPETTEFLVLSSVAYNVTSDDGFNFDARSVYLNVTAVTFWSDQNITFPNIDSFNSSIFGSWLLSPLNTSGILILTYSVQDVWGNVLVSPQSSIIISTDILGAMIIVFLAGAIFFAYLSTKSEKQNQMITLGLCLTFIILTLFAIIQISSLIGLNTGFFVAWVVVVGLILLYIILLFMVQLSTKLLKGNQNE